MPSTPPFAALPAPLREEAVRRWTQLQENVPGDTLERLDDALRASLPTLFALSPFVVESLQRDPALLHALTESDRLKTSRDWSAFRQDLEASVLETPDDAALDRLLRRTRTLEMVRIAWRDIAGLAPLEETLADLSMLAEHLIDAALARLFVLACDRFGTPLNQAGEPQNLIVLGMGKLGARELNFSSDVDLIFAYRDQGDLNDRKGTTYAEFYTRLARQLIRALDAPTADGFVFRVDTRLRPFGDSGPLVLHFDALEHYYEAQAREWERYAMIKARTVAGDRAAGQALEAFLRPFVYRRYLDYGAFGELRSLKRMILKEMARRGGPLNVKLGLGGIREIEFIGQAFQLIRGGREASLRQREILPVLDALERLMLLPAEAVHTLKTGYQTLRLVENRLQQARDQQTHVLPETPLAQAALAHALGHDNWQDFVQGLERQMNDIHQVFESVIRLEADVPPEECPLADAPEELLPFLNTLELTSPETYAEPLRGFLNQPAIRRLSVKSRTALRHVIGPMLRAVNQSAHPKITLNRTLEVLLAIAGRSVYLTLLEENPGARGRLVHLLAASPWFASTLSRFPALLDELLDHRTPEDDLDASSLAAALKARCADLDSDDLEGFMDTLRQFHQIVVLRIATLDITGRLPLPEISNALSALAQVLLSASLEEAISQTRRRHGCPPARAPECGTGFAIIAYGKLGGLELGYGSDLDLVFLYEGDDLAETDGKKPLSVAEYYGRIAQKVLHLLGTNTSQGIVYETDLRLRPSGNSGLLVSSLRAFEHYQMNEAWTWEQQALVKARFVAGDPRVGAGFEAVRVRALCRPRDLAPLAQEVIDMRERMRTTLGSRDHQQFDLKQDQGGIVDIEFLVQFLVLAGSSSDPPLTEWTDVLRLLDRLALLERLPLEDAATLRDAYLALRGEAHRAQLDERPALADPARFEALRARVGDLWMRHLAIHTPAAATNP